MDKAVSKLLKKARKAGRKLMRKLGIGKKKAGGKEDRSKQEMEADLKMGIKEGTKYVKSAEGKDEKEINSGLKKIAGKYDLKKLSLVVDKHDENGKEQVHVHGEVNPEFNGEKFTIEMDESGKVELPPDGYAYFLRQHSPMRHFKVITANGLLVDLIGIDGKVKINVKDGKFNNAFDKKGNKTLKKVVEIEIPGEGQKENFIAVKVMRSDITAKELQSKVKDYNGAPYAFGDAYDEKHKNKEINEQPIDCFKFAVDLLNDKLLIKNDRLKPTGEDNDEKYDSLLPESMGTIKRSTQ